MQFGAKPLFENISVKFGDGNRYGLIGANGCGKSTFMKILSGALEASAGNVSIAPNLRVGELSQDQFAFEKYTVVDTVIMGHDELWQIKHERERIYDLPEISDDDGMKVAELESRFAELDGYSAESRAGEILSGRWHFPRSALWTDERSCTRLEIAGFTSSSTVFESRYSIAR